MRYSIQNDEMVPVTQADWDSAMRHIEQQLAEIKRLRAVNNKATA